MRKVSLEMYYFRSYDGALALKMSKTALNSFCDKLFYCLDTMVQLRKRLDLDFMETV